MDTWSVVKERVVLVVDDEPHVARSLTRCVSLLSVTVHTALSAEEALAWVQAGGKPLAVITDLRMGGMSGLDLLDALAKAAPGAWCALHTADQRVELDLRPGQGVTVLAKPVSSEMLLRFVRAALGE